MKLILDTNIYRNLIRGLDDVAVLDLTNLILANCKEKNIEILFPINSAMELVSHYNDDIEIERVECRSALKMLVRLSTLFSSTKLNVEFVPPLNSVLEKYFGGETNLYTELYMRVITLCQMLVGNIMPLSEDKITMYIEIVKQQLEFEKKEIRDNYENYLKSINNGNADWTYFQNEGKKQERKSYFALLHNGGHSFLVAESMVNRAHEIIGIKISRDEEYFRKIQKFISDFCPALLMNEKLLENIGNGVEAIQETRDKRWNTIIDISLIFGALYNPDAEVRKLVTEEKGIHEAFNHCNFSEKIMTLQGFKNLVDI